MFLLRFTKSLKRDNILILYLWMLEEENCLISTSDIEAMLRKLILRLHFTESLKRYITYDLCLWILEEPIYLVFTPLHVLSGGIGPVLGYMNLSDIAQSHSSNDNINNVCLWMSDVQC